jgi:hypothetical protein
MIIGARPPGPGRAAVDGWNSRSSPHPAHTGADIHAHALSSRSRRTAGDQLQALAASGENSVAIAVRLNRTAAGVRRRAMDLGIKLAGSKRELGLKAKK